jgi:hypothetical protein
MKQQRWINETYIICRTQNSKEINWSYPLIRSEDPDPCPASLVMSPGRRCFGQSRRRSQKPICRSPCKISNGKGFGGMWFSRFCSRVPSDRGLPYLTSWGKLKEEESWRRRIVCDWWEAEGEGSARPPTTPEPGRRWRRARVARPCTFLDFSN